MCPFEGNIVYPRRTYGHWEKISCEEWIGAIISSRIKEIGRN
jgi:hypothetical protein